MCSTVNLESLLLKCHNCFAKFTIFVIYFAHHLWNTSTWVQFFTVWRLRLHVKSGSVCMAGQLENAIMKYTEIYCVYAMSHDVCYCMCKVYTYGMWLRDRPLSDFYIKKNSHIKVKKMCFWTLMCIIVV